MVLKDSSVSPQLITLLAAMQNKLLQVETRMQAAERTVLELSNQLVGKKWRRRTVISNVEFECIDQAGNNINNIVHNNNYALNKIKITSKTKLSGLKCVCLRRKILLGKYVLALASNYCPERLSRNAIIGNGITLIPDNHRMHLKSLIMLAVSIVCRSMASWKIRMCTVQTTITLAILSAK